MLIISLFICEDLCAISSSFLDLKSTVGYRQMREIVSMKYNVNLLKESVRQALLIVNLDGVENRRKRTKKRRIYESKGPFDIVHIDRNDKLKRFGFAIHGAIDGFSRKLLWPFLSTTNNDPLVIANYYLNCIKHYKKAPKTLRMDLGTENIYCEDLQVYFTKKQIENPLRKIDT